MTSTTKTQPTTAEQADDLKFQLKLAQDRRQAANKHLNDCDIIIKANQDEFYYNSINWTYLNQTEDLKVRTTRKLVAFEIEKLDILIDDINDLINELGIFH